MGNFSFSAVIGGKQRWLKFSGSKSDEGYYSTSDIAEQCAIESSRRYRRGEIKLVGNYNVADEEPIGSVADENANARYAEGEVVAGITTVQAAREWLVEHKDAKASELNNKDAVLSYAKQHGVLFAEL